MDELNFDNINWKHLKSDEISILRYHLRRREAQTCPEPRPFIWLLLGGRGSGKTWTAANWIFEYARYLAINLPRIPEHDIIRIALVGQTFSDVQGTMVEGQSGLRTTIPEELQIKYNRSTTELWVSIPSADRTIYFKGFTSQVPEKLRGPQFHAAWIDEPAKLQDANMDPLARDTTWSNLLLGTRLGKEVNAPHIVVTGTPTPCKLVRYFMEHKQCVITKMTTFENSENLADNYLNELKAMNPNSRTYRQEVTAEVLLDNPNAVFNEESIQMFRYDALPEDKEMFKTLGWDPSVSTSEEADEAGIMLVGYTPEIKEKARGKGGKGRPTIIEPSHAYLLKDLSGHMSPHDQAVLIVDTILQERVSDLVFETNQGSEVLIQMIENVLKEKVQDYRVKRAKKRSSRDYGSIQRYHFDCTVLDEEGLPYRYQFTANGVHVSKNKQSRAETAALKYDQGRVHHPPGGDLPVCRIPGCSTSLESQMTSWDPTNKSSRRYSPDRMDALVYALFLIFGTGSRTKGHNTTLDAPTGPSPYDADPNRRPLHTEKKIAPTSIYSMDLVSGRGSDGRTPHDYYGSDWARPII